VTPAYSGIEMKTVVGAVVGWNRGFQSVQGKTVLITGHSQCISLSGPTLCGNDVYQAMHLLAQSVKACLSGHPAITRQRCRGTPLDFLNWTRQIYVGVTPFQKFWLKKLARKLCWITRYFSGGWLFRESADPW
jgi:hypothetical protein